MLWSCKFSDDGSTIGVGCIGCTGTVYLLNSIGTSGAISWTPGVSSGTNDVDFKANNSKVLFSGLSTDSNLYQITFTTTSSAISTTSNSTNNKVDAVSCSKDGSYTAIGLNNTGTVSNRF